MTESCAKRVAILLFPDVQLLDVAGPASVFGKVLTEGGSPGYEVVLVSSSGGEVRTDCGVSLTTRSTIDVAPDSVDTLILTGGEELAVAAALRDRIACAWTRQAALHVRRLSSVCSGAFLLVDWGLVDGRRVATHWRAAQALSTREPRIQVDPESLFVEDGPVWTSAGVTTGIDMSLAMVERDHGHVVAHQIARELVLYARRPGYQSQFAGLFEVRDGAYRQLISWIGKNLQKPLDLDQLAAREGESSRNFHRKFSAATGLTPAAFVERLRLERARKLLEAGTPLSEVAVACGFGSLDRMGRAFKAGLGLMPSTYRVLHGHRQED